MSIDVAVVGANFGAEFAPIYAAHPEVGRVAVVDQDLTMARAYAKRWGMDAAYGSLDELLVTDEWDAVHIATPVPLHAQHTLAVLGSGRHCACAVPIALERDDLDAVIAAATSSGRNYMMMETSVYAREFLLAQDLLDRGDLGDVTFYRGVHVQNLDGFPPYWMGYPPMRYITHALSPALALLGTTADAVHCLGSGHLAAHQRGGFGNPFPVETAIFRLSGTDVAAEITMSFFATARAYQEGFSVYGTRAGLEWPPAEGDPQLFFRLGPPPDGRRGGQVDVTHRPAPDRADLLPAPLSPFTLPHRRTLPGGEEVEMPSHHGGSHPHLVHEFVTSIVQERPPRIDAMTAADWTVPGMCAHASAMNDGAGVRIPNFRTTSAVHQRTRSQSVT